MNVIVVSRSEIERGIVVREPYVVISISDPQTRRPRLKRPATFRGALFVQFHDAEPVAGSPLPPDVVTMSLDQACEIWRFVAQHRRSVETIVVHCEQGMSRSPAVAAAICRWFDVDDSRFFEDYQPNQFVYKLLLGVANTEDH